MKHMPLDSRIKERAAAMRKEMTPEEKKLWFGFLCQYEFTFRRQKPMDSFILDFYCHQAKLVIEVDGSQHYSEQGKGYDEWREHILHQNGIEILRVSNLDINKHFNNVMDHIDYVTRKRIKK